MSRRCLPSFGVKLPESDGSNDVRREALQVDIHSSEKAACMEQDWEEKPVEQVCGQGVEDANGTAKSLAAR